MSADAGSALAQDAAVHVLHPGDVACGGQGETFKTLLGSCVSVILTDPRRTVGAMCHIVHSRPAMGRSTPSGAYGNVAFDTMFLRLTGRGIAPSMCHAWVYGGANMFPALVRDAHVGEQNAHWVLATLAAARIHVLDTDLGGIAYRRLEWTVGSGDPVVHAITV